MKQTRRWSENTTIIILLFTGLVLSIVGIVIWFFPLSWLAGSAIYFAFAYLYGRKVYKARWGYGLVMAFSSMALSIYFISSMDSNFFGSIVGRKHFLNLILIPLASCLGIWLRVRSKQKIEMVDDQLLE